MNISLTIPERLKDLRNERGLDIADVSKAIGISSSALSNYENDESADAVPFPPHSTASPVPCGA